MDTKTLFEIYKQAYKQADDTAGTNPSLVSAMWNAVKTPVVGGYNLAQEYTKHPYRLFWKDGGPTALGAATAQSKVDDLKRARKTVGGTFDAFASAFGGTPSYKKTPEQRRSDVDFVRRQEEKWKAEADKRRAAWEAYKASKDKEVQAQLAGQSGTPGIAGK